MKKPLTAHEVAQMTGYTDAAVSYHVNLGRSLASILKRKKLHNGHQTRTVMHTFASEQMSVKQFCAKTGHSPTTVQDKLNAGKTLDMIFADGHRKPGRPLGSKNKAKPEI